MIQKQYRLQADEAAGPALRRALDDLAARVAAVPGAIRVDLYRDAGDPQRFVMVEQWESTAAHQASGEFLGKDAFRPVMALLNAPPLLDTLIAVSTNGKEPAS